MLDEPTVMGVERIEAEAFSVRMVARTLPGMQFDIGREIRARVASARVELIARPLTAMAEWPGAGGAKADRRDRLARRYRRGHDDPDGNSRAVP